MEGTTYGIPNGLSYAQFVDYMVSIGYQRDDPYLPSIYANYVAAGGLVVTPETPPPPPVTPPPAAPAALDFPGAILNAVNNILDWTYQIYTDISGWVWPFSGIAPAVYWVYSAIADLGWGLYDLFAWVNDVQAKIGSGIDWGIIWGNILSYIPNINDMSDWFGDWAGNVASAIAGWWSATSATVQGWITASMEAALDLIDTISVSIAALQESWDGFSGTIPTITEIIAWWGNWTGSVTSAINTWWATKLLDVQELINTAIKVALPFYDDLVNIWGDIKSFFVNPLDYLWERFVDWFLGPEE